MAQQRARLLGAAIALLVTCGSTAAADSTTKPDTSVTSAVSMDPALDTAWARVLDHDIPLADRQRMLTDLEAKAAQSNDAHALYMLGSLYHMGQHATDSPVQQDLAKASLYLGNAAIRGSILAMAKMAELKLIQGQYREAMNWAQIYAHYALQSKTDKQDRQSYAGELIQRIMEHIGDAQMPAIMKDVDSFVAAYDVNIRVGLQEESSLDQLHPSTPRHRYKPALDERVPDAGIADFIVAFRPDGSVSDVRVVDAMPRPEMAAMMHEYAASLRVTPGTGQALRYGWMPVMMDDRRYRTTTRH